MRSANESGTRLFGRLATILNLVLRPTTWAAVATTALTIVVRKLITTSLARSALE